MRKKLKYGDASICYEVLGTGMPVILLHGFGEDRNIWKRQVLALSSAYTVILPDLPGSGESEMVSDMSIDGMAEVVHEIIHQENIEQCPVIGHSMGGYIALALADKYYNHVSALGLFHSTAFADSEEKVAARKKGIAFIEEYGSGAFLKTSIPNLFCDTSKDEQPELITQLLAEAHNFLPSTLVSYYNSMMNRPDRTNLLKSTNIPVLFVIGKYDIAVPMPDMLEQGHLPKKSYIHILQKSGHMGMLEEAEKTTVLLGDFLKESCVLDI